MAQILLLFCMNTQALSRNHTIELLGITEELPTLPDRFFKIQHVLNDPNSGANDIAKIIQTDQASTVMVMKVANSPAYNPMNRPISRLSQAIARLGTGETASIAMSMSLLYGFAIPAGISIIREFWAHAFAVGMLSRHLRSKLPDNIKALDPESMFMVGLLHDIGKAILGIRIDLTYFEREQFRLFGEQLSQAEDAHYGMNHAEVGQFILHRWGMSDEISETVGSHHQSNEKNLSAKICSIADTFIHKHLTAHNSIETVHIAFADGLLEKAEEELIHSGLITPQDEKKSFR